MLQYKKLFMDYMDSQGVKYTDFNENVVKIVYNGKNLRAIPVFAIFDKNGENLVELKCLEVANFKDKEAKALVACNELNSRFRWVKFYLNSEAEIVVDADAILDEATCGQECLSMVRRVVDITDTAYPTFAKALWS